MEDHLAHDKDSLAKKSSNRSRRKKNFLFYFSH
jgi:hypothetical protein